MRHAVTLVVFRSDLARVLDTIGSTLRQTRPPDLLHVLVSGADPEDDLARAIADLCATAPSGTVCRVTVRPDNLGFAGGHNYLADQAFASGAHWVTLLNPDLELDPSAFARYWDSVERYADVFAVHGPQLVSGRGDAEVVDSAGIVWTRDGRHFDLSQGEPSSTLPDSVVAAEGVSGALLTLSRATHARLVADGGEFLDDLFLAYREDAELGRRVQVMGGQCLIHPSRDFRHERGARNAERTSRLQRALGVQNRFLLRWRLGTHRPGATVPALGRDLLVVGAVLVWETSSRSGLRRAWAVRRFERYKGRAFTQSSGQPSSLPDCRGGRAR